MNFLDRPRRWELRLTAEMDHRVNHAPDRSEKVLLAKNTENILMFQCFFLNRKEILRVSFLDIQLVSDHRSYRQNQPSVAYVR